MRIQIDESTFLFPEKNQLNLMVENSYREQFIRCLEEYFGNKKKKYCKIFDDSNNPIGPEEIEFIYFPYKNDYSNNYSLKSKSIMNTEFTGYIENNPDKFHSIERIRDNLKSLQTDEGMYILKKQLSRGIDTTINISFAGLDIANILQMMEVESELLDSVDQCLILYNLLLFEFGDSPKILYLDLPLSNKVIKWINEIIDENIFIIMDNSQMEYDSMSLIKECSLVKMSGENFLQEERLHKKELYNYSYIFHPFILKNIMLQTEKNIDLYNQFSDENTTFCLMFSPEYL